MTSHRIPISLLTFVLAIFFMLSSAPVTGSLNVEAASSPASKSSVKKSGKESKKSKISINSADAKSLTQVPGIGPKTAKAIVEFRKKHGKFKSLDELLQIKGIGKKTLKKMKPMLKL